MSYGQNLLLALDQLGNAVLAGSPDETMSARSYRLHRDSKPWGALMVVIDWMFSWQKPVEGYIDLGGALVTAHCKRAYMKELARYYLPDEYRAGSVRVLMQPDGHARVEAA